MNSDAKTLIHPASRITEEEAREFVRWMCRARHWTRLTSLASHLTSGVTTTVYGIETRRRKGISQARVIRWKGTDSTASFLPSGMWRSMAEAGELYADLASLVESTVETLLLSVVAV